MPLLTLGGTYGEMTWGVECHLRQWRAHTVGRCRAWHTIITLGLHTRSADIGRGNAIIYLGQHTRSDDIER